MDLQKLDHLPLLLRKMFKQRPNLFPFFHASILLRRFRESFDVSGNRRLDLLKPATFSIEINHAMLTNRIEPWPHGPATHIGVTDPMNRQKRILEDVIYRFIFAHTFNQE